MKKYSFYAIIVLFILSYAPFRPILIYGESIENKPIVVGDILGEWKIRSSGIESDSIKRRIMIYHVCPRIVFEDSSLGKVILNSGKEEPFKWQITNDTIRFKYLNDVETFIIGEKFKIRIYSEEKYKKLELKVLNGESFYVLTRPL